MHAGSAPAARLLTVDLGNTKAALRLWELSPADALAAEPRARARLETGERLGVRLAEWLEQVGGAAHAALASVASPALTREVEARLRASCGGRVAAPPAPGLRLDLERSDTVGQDRLFAARAAVERVQGRVVVVDAGTALTVDAVGWTPEGGVFLGGAIAPGPSLVADALAAGGSRLPRVEPRPGAPALGRDTPAALRAGIAASQRGAVRELLDQLLREPAFAAFGSAPPTVVLTGGARAYLLEPEPCFGLPWTERPDLVHEGLWLSWRADAE